MATIAERTIHIFVFVQIDHEKHVKVEFDKSRVTGAEIKAKAGVPSDYELAIVHGQRHEAVRDNQEIEIRDGEHFVAVPGGSVS